jgi:catechol 2,3-dioxygenase-like lactoylglutathione lyase family enzyme
MTIQRLENVGIVVDDLAAATTFFVELGLKVLGEGPVEGGWVDRVVGLEVSAVSHLPSMTSTPPSPGCKPAARSCRWGGALRRHLPALLCP